MGRHRPVTLAPAILFAAACGVGAEACHAPAPLGEIVMTVDTDATVPSMVSRLRIDLFTADGRWYESRDYPASSGWPLSFAVALAEGDASRNVRVRLRGYLDGRVRDASTVDPPAEIAPSPSPSVQADACASAALYRVGEVVRLRASRSSPFGVSTCSTVAAATVARIQVDAAGPLVFRALAGSDPLRPVFLPGDCATARTSCPVPDTTVATGVHAIAFTTDFPYADLRFVFGPPEQIDALALQAERPPTQARLGLHRTPDGPDETPDTEPQPGTTIDRLVDLRVVAGAVGHARVTLRTGCFGLASRPREGLSCLGGDRLEPIPPPTAGTLARDDAPTSSGSFERALANTAPSRSGDEICVPRGAMRLGDRGLLEEVMITPVAPMVPEREVVVGPLCVDRTELTVGTYRALLAGGFSPPEPLGPDPSCTIRGADALPLNCVSWPTARAVCRALGRDLPTEAEWEYVATTAGYATKSRFPWNASANACDRVNAGCSPLAGSSIAAVDDPRFAADHTPLGVLGMIGNLDEWTLDAGLDFDAGAWRFAPGTAPAALDDLASTHVARGTSVFHGALLAGGDTRRYARTFTTGSATGFRCVRRP